jgi:hypothetical protein
MQDLRALRMRLMGELMRRRAVELAFEGLRWHDLRRWNVAGDKKIQRKNRH